MKRNRFFQAGFIFALTAALCLSGFSTVFAAGEITGTEADPPQAAITKKLVMAEGLATPAASFIFSFSKKDFNDAATEDALASMPDLNTSIAEADRTVIFSAADAGNTSAGVKTVTKETDSIFAGITWPGVGIYTYTITEQTNTYTTGAGETMSYSPGVYDISVYVDNGSAAGTFYISAIGTTVKTIDNSSQTVDTKVVPTPGVGGLVFTNVYQKMNGGTDPVANSVLAISKTVTGSMADLTKFFSFELTVNKAATISGTPVYKVYVLDSANAVVTSTDNVDAGFIKEDTSDPVRQYIEVTAGTLININLKHGQRLSFVDAAVGTTYTVNELAAANYTPSVSVIVGGGDPVVNDGTLATSLSSGPNLVGDGANSTAFTNTYQTVSPTGISINNLPFYIMIALAIGALIAFVVVKARKGAYSSRH